MITFICGIITGWAIRTFYEANNDKTSNSN